ncbi:MAG TPA: hypothetical protein PKW12_03655 [Verrucomicrobiota bacterium]|nr:hypothetical protein [Verrucomicrobiota bacterium]
MKLLWQPVLLALAASLAGCATSRKPAVPPLTGDILVDAPRAIASGPARDRLIWQYRLAAAAMRQGKFDLAKQNLDEVLLTLGGIYGKDPDAKKARSYFRAEARKTFIGEPYERSMAYIYRGIIYWMDGERDNARACFRSAEFEDSDAALQEYAGDWVLPDYLDGLATAKLGGDGSDAFQRAQANAKGIKLPPARPEANVLFFVEFGPGPTKYATGQYQQELRFNTPASPVASAMLKVDARQIPIAPTDDVGFQATTRGGRMMDHILGNKAVFKSATDAAGSVAMLGGITTAVASRDRTTQQVGLGIALAGLATTLVSAATVPKADTRAWDNLPRYLSFACLPLPVGQHVATLQFLDSAGQVQSNLTKTITLNIATTDRDKVVFVSDASITPQTL